MIKESHYVVIRSALELHGLNYRGRLRDFVVDWTRSVTKSRACDRCCSSSAESNSNGLLARYMHTS